MRIDGRSPSQFRKIALIPDVLKHAEGSVEIQMGDTKLICSATVELSLPKWIRTPEMGWVTAEYGMLPRSTHQRIKRDRALNAGRSQEISRLIARSLRTAVDLKKLGERQITVDCDVIQADGGTRTSAITGGFVALALSLGQIKKECLIEHIPLKHYVSAISLGLLKGEILLDLCYEEDQKAEMDMNVVFASTGDLIEIQGTAEKQNFSRSQLNQILDLAWPACQKLFKEQEKTISALGFFVDSYTDRV